MKRILLVAPSSAETIERSYLGPNLGIVRLSGYLSAHGHHAEYFDPSLKIATGEGPSIEEKFVERDWDIIGISCLDDTLLSDIRNIYHAKELCPGALLVAGGIEAQFNYQTILDKTPARIVVLGEGEIPLLEIANGTPLHEIPGVVVKNPSRALSQEQFEEATYSIDWENVPFETYWDHYVEKYGGEIDEQKNQEIHTARVFSRNRCPIGCKFCSSTNQLTWGAGVNVPVISTTEDNLISVVQRIKDAHPRVRTIYLTDDDFCIDKRSVMRFCDKVVEQDFGDLTFMCFARASDLNLKLLEKMKAANFRRLIIGVESFSQTVLDDMNKHCSVQQIHDALHQCHEVGIKPHINIILTTPYSSLDEIEVSIDNALWYIERDYVHCAVMSAIRPLKGTDYFELHSDYETRMAEIEGTDYKLKIDDYIISNDPVSKEVQEIYWSGVDDEVDRYAEMVGLKHKSTNDIAKISLLYMKRLIREARAKYHLPKFDSELPVKGANAEIQAIYKDYLLNFTGGMIVGEHTDEWPTEFRA
ncbi:MAG: radical SAM protein [Rhodospirillales bacterium]|jgi:radical SAM superfamily enzyme YgiQ (UPF0313 family)|nr:radical SAM protein [Rhodospirillales bacterium]MDP6645238.1 radical SAM protein [Rhodospirillales bacterium]|tara:strand:+ start:453 stop:2042 length:1590 start_codon:yes stop_codon:yes gene_type:complete